MTADQALDRYLEEAVSWDRDRLEQLGRNRRTAWWVASAGWACAMISSAAVLSLMPLKTVEPFVIRVDNSTGIVDVVPVYSGTAHLDEAVTRYFLSHYVSVCERFNIATAESDYEECGAFQTAQRSQSWAALWTPSNPASPLNLHRDGSRVRVEVESVSFFKRATGIADLAQVRYHKAESRGQDAPEHITHWIATVQYAYVSPSKDPRARRWNPLGFKIVELGTEPEVPGSISASTPTSRSAP